MRASRSRSRTPATATLGGAQFWSDELIFHRWRIQLNAFTGYYRLLDGDDYRHTWGFV
jgi:hypothetical protein